MGFLLFCDVSISSDGNALARGEILLYFCAGRVLISIRGCSRDVGVLFLSVGSLGRIKFGAIYESDGFGGGSFCFSSSMSSFVISTMVVICVISLIILESY